MFDALQEKTLKKNLTKVNLTLFGFHFPQVFLPQSYYPLQSPPYTNQLVRCWHEMHCECSLTLILPCAMLLPQTIFQPPAASKRPIRKGEMGSGRTFHHHSTCLFCILASGVEMWRGGQVLHPDTKTKTFVCVRWLIYDPRMETCPSVCSLVRDAATLCLSFVLGGQSRAFRSAGRNVNVFLFSAQSFLRTGTRGFSCRISLRTHWRCLREPLPRRSSSSRCVQSNQP